MENFDFGWASLGLSVILHLLPIVSFINFFGKKITFESLPSSKIFTNYANCLIWYFYGSMLFNNIIRFSNMIGAIISLIYIMIYLFLEIKIYLLDTILNCIIVIIGTMVSYEWFSHIILEKYIVGRTCLLINVVSFMSQLPDIYYGIKEKNYLLFRINYSIISFPTYFCWIIFALIIRDLYVLIANIIGIIFSIIHILLYVCYKTDYPPLFDEENTSIGIFDEFKKESNSPKERTVEIINLK